MKKLITCAILMLFSLIAFSQNIEYPRYQIDSLGQQVIVMTIEQAQTLDNNSELLSLFEKLNSQMSEYDSICVKVVNDKDKVITSQKMEISNLKKSLENKDQQIKALQGEIASYLTKILILEEQVQNRQSVIDLKDKQIRRMKTKMIIGGVGSGLAVVGLILGLILVH